MHVRTRTGETVRAKAVATQVLAGRVARISAAKNLRMISGATNRERVQAEIGQWTTTRGDKS